MFGRDYFDGRQFEALDQLDLPEDVLDNVYHANAERLIRNC